MVTTLGLLNGTIYLWSEVNNNNMFPRFVSCVGKEIESFKLCLIELGLEPLPQALRIPEWKVLNSQIKNSRQTPDLSSCVPMLESRLLITETADPVPQARPLIAFKCCAL